MSQLLKIDLSCSSSEVQLRIVPATGYCLTSDGTATKVSFGRMMPESELPDKPLHVSHIS